MIAQDTQIWISLKTIELKKYVVVKYGLNHHYTENSTMQCFFDVANGQKSVTLSLIQTYATPCRHCTRDHCLRPHNASISGVNCQNRNYCIRPIQQQKNRNTKPCSVAKELNRHKILGVHVNNGSLRHQLGPTIDYVVGTCHANSCRNHIPLVGPIWCHIIYRAHQDTSVHVSSGTDNCHVICGAHML